MNKKKLFLFLLGIFFIVTDLIAQEDRVVIISPRVGLEIDRGERDQFHLFQRVDNFVRAKAFVTAEDSFYFRVGIITRTGDRDTILKYSKNAILLLSEKIDHMESIIDGSYRMGTDPATITVTDGEKYLRDSIDYRIPLPDRKPFQNELLPFTGKPQFKDEIPRYQFGVGFSTYSPDVHELQDAFVVIANRYKNRVLPNQTFVAQKPELNFSPLVWFTFSIRFAKEWGMTVETSEKKDGEDVFRAFSLSLEYYPLAWETESFHPFVGGGYGRYFISTTVPYTVAIDTIISHSNGWYTTTIFEKITAQAGKNGIHLTSGCTYDISSYFGVQITLKYLVVPEMKTMVNENIPVAIFLGSVIAGAQFHIVF